MKIFLSESTPDYSSYTFNYALYCVQENKAEVPNIYAKGFLPYTGNPALEHEVYYLARSLRVDLDNFSDTSENRRVARKAEELDIKLELIKKQNFDLSNTDFVKFCTAYAADRFHDGSMSAERLQYVVSRENASHLFEFTSKGVVVGYVLAVINAGMLHYWYAFFDVQYLQSHSLGKWLMWRVIKWAKENGLNYVYLGTCYGKHALYKIRDHKGLEYWEGNRWSTNTKRLKELCKSDQGDRNADLFKLADNQNEVIGAVHGLR